MLYQTLLRVAVLGFTSLRFASFGYYRAMLRLALLRYAMLYFAMLCFAILCWVRIYLCYAILRLAKLSLTPHCLTSLGCVGMLLRHAWLCQTTLYFARLYYAPLSWDINCAVLRSTSLNQAKLGFASLRDFKTNCVVWCGYFFFFESSLISSIL